MNSDAWVKGAVESFRGRKVLVVGDLMLDRYVSSTVSRICPEAPVPVVEVANQHSCPGGSANVALNVQALGGQATVLGIVGDDDAGDELLKLLRGDGICTDGVIVCPGRTTTTKTRILADRQQVVRVDFEDSSEVADRDMSRLCSGVAELMEETDGVVMEDYGRGVLTQRVVDAVEGSSANQDVVVGFDPKQGHALDISGIDIATPNLMEACSVVALPLVKLGSGDGGWDKLAEVARLLKEKWRVSLLVVTLGSHGMYLISGDNDPVVTPTNAQEVFDVSGAGDTVIATGVLALSAGVGHLEAAHLANLAAGLVVGRIGAATCSAQELVDAAEHSA